jgi:hypothetical protein
MGVLDMNVSRKPFASPSSNYSTDQPNGKSPDYRFILWNLNIEVKGSKLILNCES